MGTALVVITMTLAMTGGVYWVAARPVLRERRLRSVRSSIHVIRKESPEFARTSGQHNLDAKLSELDAIGTLATRVEAQALALPIPIPLQPQRGTAGAAMDEMARLLNDPKIAIAVAGGEQLAVNLFDMARAGAAATLGGHVMKGLLEGAREAISTSEGLVPLGCALIKEGSLHFKDVAATVGEHIAHHAVEGAASEVGAHLSESFDLESAAGFHFPFVTLLTTSARECKLLFDRKTSFDRALLHVALDTGATAAGGLAGAKAGAALGTVIAPGIGTAVGGLLGTIFGAMGGRQIATDIKYKPLREAAADYEKASEEARVAVENSAYGVTERVHRSASTAREAYLNGPAAPRIPVDGPRVDALRRAARDLQAAIASRFHEARKVIDASFDQVRAGLPPRRWYDGVLGLDVSQQSKYNSLQESDQSGWRKPISGPVAAPR